MALNLSIDLEDATFADLTALVRAAQVAGVDNASRIELEDTTLIITSTTPAIGAAGASGAAESSTGRHSRSHDPFGFDGIDGRDRHDDRVLPVLGENAIRSVIDILTGRQEPPR